MSVRIQSSQDSQLLLEMQNKSPTSGSCLAVSHEVKHVPFQWNKLHSLFVYPKEIKTHSQVVNFLSPYLDPCHPFLEFPFSYPYPWFPHIQILCILFIYLFIYFGCGPFLKLGFPVAQVVKIPKLERSSGGGHGSPLQYSSLENPMDRGAW